MKQKITCVIVDDELKACENLHLLLEMFCKEVEVLAVASNVEDAIAAVCRYRPQILFLDIQMGRELSFIILEKTQHIRKALIFTTAHNEYASQAFQSSAVDYLLKPISAPYLQQAVAKAADSLKRSGGHEHPEKETDEPQKIFVPERGGWRAIDVETIVYIEADRSYAKIHLRRNQVVVVSKNLKFIESLLGKHPGFLRIHKSYIVCLKCVKNVLKQNNGYLLLDGDAMLPVAKDVWEHLLNILRINTSS